jgi:hypothetical protein
MTNVKVHFVLSDGELTICNAMGEPIIKFTLEETKALKGVLNETMVGNSGAGCTSQEP